MKSELNRILGFCEVGTHEQPAAQHWAHRLRWVMLFVVLLTIPAFYLELAAPDARLRHAGSLLYLFVAAAFACYFLWMSRLVHERWNYFKRNWLDLLILLGAALSLAGSYGDWSALEWTLRLGYVALIFVRIVLFLIPLLTPSGILPVIALGALLLALSGAVFYWLEPNVHSYADGLWLAFVTSATVGYGDLVPTTAASRIFAVFIVLLGYAVISLVIASIAALFIGEDERALRREMHRDIQALRREVALLRTALQPEDARTCFEKTDATPDKLSDRVPLRG